MLKRTFIHVPGVGPKTELKLWEGGIVSWEDYLTNSGQLSVGRQSRLNLDEYIERSLEALRGGDALFFERLLPKREIWRIYPEFQDRCVFLDIETTGLGGPGDYVTVIGLFNGRQIKTFIRGQNLEEFATELKRYSVIVTYNGKCFDLPFIRSEYKDLEFTQAHIDLRYFLYRLGYSGGLKQVEIDVGIRREKGLEDIDGYLAAVLWQKYLEGDERALHALVRYNIEDIVNLKYLIEFGYNRMIDSFPILMDHLEPGRRIRIDVPFDPSIIREIRGERRWTL
jgi:hypothetical protein